VGSVKDALELLASSVLGIHGILARVTSGWWFPTASFHQHFTLHTARCTLHYSHYQHHTAHCMLYTPQYTQHHTAQCTLHSPQFTLPTSHCTLHTSPFTLQTTHSTLHATPSTIRTTNNTPHTARCTLHNSQNKHHTAHSTLHAPQYTLLISTSRYVLHTAHYTLRASCHYTHLYFTETVTMKDGKQQKLTIVTVAQGPPRVEVSINFWHPVHCNPAQVGGWEDMLHHAVDVTMIR